MTLLEQLRLYCRFPRFRAFDGFSRRSRTLCGPYATVGDCAWPGEESLGAIFTDPALPIRPGDLGVWFLPELAPRERRMLKGLPVGVICGRRLFREHFSLAR